MRRLNKNSEGKILLQKETMQTGIKLFSQAVFYLGWFIELTIVLLDKSAYTLQYEGLWFRFTFLLFGLSLITTRHSRREWLWLCLMGIVGILSYRATGRNEILRGVVFLWACVGKDIKRVFRFTFWYTAAGCSVLILLSLLGISGEVIMEKVYQLEGEVRYCLGMGHANAFHCMMLALTFLGLYCYYDRLQWWGYAGIAAGHILLYFLTRSEAGFLVALGVLLLAILMERFSFLKSWKGSYLLGILIVAAAVAFSVFMAAYGMEHPFLVKLDRYLTGRITTLYADTKNREGMLHTWSLWSVARNNYFFDLGIVRMFYWFGIIPSAIYFLAHGRLIWCGFRRRDYMMLILVISITIYTLFEAHYVSDYMGRNYILLFMGMYLKEMVGDGKEESAAAV